MNPSLVFNLVTLGLSVWFYWWYLPKRIIPSVRLKAQRDLRARYLNIVANGAKAELVTAVADNGPLEGHAFQILTSNIGVHFSDEEGHLKHVYALSFDTDDKGRRLFKHVPL